MTSRSPQQHLIFDWFRTGKGNLVVRARAGTGKTTTIVEGINFAREEKILLAAFNKKIAIELNQRIQNPRAEAKTLHAIGMGLCLRNWKGCQVDEDRGERLARQVSGDEVPVEIVKLIARLASRAKSTKPFPKSTKELEDEAEDGDIVPDVELERQGWTRQFIAEKAMKAMDLACIKDGFIDFDDMVFIPLRNNWVFGRWNLVVIDEAQDLCHSQLMLAQRVCKPGGRIAVVGDDRQAIYGFRGADSGSIDRLKKGLKATELGLTITYRCPRLIVDLAKKIVPDYESAPGAPDGIIERSIREKALQDVLPGDFILSRKNAPLASICLALLKLGKRAKVEGKDVGKGLINIVRKVKGKNIPDFIDRLNKWKLREIERAGKLDERRQAARIDLLSDQFDTLVTLSEDIVDVKGLITRIEGLFGDVATSDPHSYIICSSTHKAKGLERDNVYLVEETFNERNREESNIKYVAITRAKKRLVWITTDIDDRKDFLPPIDFIYPKQLVADVASGVLDALTEQQQYEWVNMNTNPLDIDRDILKGKK